MDSGTRICGFRRPEQGAQMNWKQKVLTILALILFLTIGWLHLAEIAKELGRALIGWENPLDVRWK